MTAAYIDPSSMTYLIQIIAGVAIAAAAGVGFYWKRIKRFLRKKKEDAAGGATVAQDGPDDLCEGETITAEMLRSEKKSVDDANHTAEQ